MSSSRTKSKPTTSTVGFVLSEDQFKKRIMDTAMLHGWRICHVRPARKLNGKWTTPTEGHAGLPDLILARDGRVLLVELKSEKGKPTDDQIAWLLAAGRNGHLWRPSDWPMALDQLSSPRRLVLRENDR